MKSKNIPVDIRAKSIKEALNEIKEIILKLEDSDTNLEDSRDQYNRMLQLNEHIQNEYKKKATEIQQSTLKKREKIFSRNK
tara:strand:- start:524 stop:766 length:243 start_codon:yes stop_codon:yes gene_type:complete